MAAMAGHDHAHSHTDPSGGNEKRILWAMALTGSFMVAEVIGGILSGSLALIADAGHMLTDFAALALSWAAFRASRRPHDTKRTYGYHRFQVLAAFVNGLTMVLIVGWILFEAVRRLMEPVDILAGPMLVIAMLGLVVNIIAFAILHAGAKENLNMQGAALHVLGDLLGSVAAIAAAGVILWTGWSPIDPLLSAVVALLILRSALSLVRKSAHILLEGTPEWLDVDALRADLERHVPEVEDVHHVHAWMLTQEKVLMTLHVAVANGADTGPILEAVQNRLRETYGVDHATIQIEPADIARRHAHVKE